MTLPDLKELDKLIALCRKRGVKVVKIGEMELTLADEAPESKYKRNRKSKKETFNFADEEFQSDGLTDEQLLFYSVTDPTPGGES